MSQVNRRELLLAGAAGAVALGPLGCGSGGSSTSAGTGGSSTTGGKPVRGGTLSLGIIGGGRAETLDPAKAISSPDFVRSTQLYDRLFGRDKENQVIPELAESAEPSSDALRWTFKLRDGVVFHDGRPFTSADVVYTIRQWTKKTHPAYGPIGSLIDPDSIRAQDKLTVEMRMLKGKARIAELLTQPNMQVVPDGGIDPRKPVGTGPFKFESFTPGSRSVFAANPNYWIEGKPYVDKLQIISSFKDNGAIYNAGRSGQIDIVHGITAKQAQAQERRKELTILRAQGTKLHTIVMRVDTAPFDDVRVRKAMKLIIDRDEMIKQVISGYGSVGHDLPCKGQQFYASDLKSVHDPEQAQALLREAGHDKLSVTLHFTSGEDFDTQATVFGQQLKEAGVDVRLKQEDFTQYFDTSTLYPKLPFWTNTWGSMTAGLSAWWGSTLMPDAIYNETHWNSEKTKSLFEQTERETDETRAAEMWHELQQEQFDEGGNITWGFADYLDGLGRRVKGLTPSKAHYCGGYDFKSAYLES